MSSEQQTNGVSAGQPPVATHSTSTSANNSARSTSFSVDVSSTGPAAAVAPAAAPASPGISMPPALVNKPTFLEDPKIRERFLIMDAPNDANLASYLDVLKKRQVVAVARVCDPTYGTAPLSAIGIKVVEVPFADGDPPPQHVVDRWLALVDQVFRGTPNPDVELQMAGVEKPAIAVHCVAGLGRAPVLVAIALVESGMEPFDAIAFIRKKRRGAINARQLKYIESYRPQRGAKGCCTVQ